ncbi:MAG: cbb3-type cytochrome c oxidase subunit II [Actinomycetota bacterium]
MRLEPVVAGTLGLFLLGAGLVLGGPIVAKSTVATVEPLTRIEASGRSVYEAQGCIYCHTQQVRAVSNDIGLGSATDAGRIAREDRPMLGFQRIGPDLSCFGDRQKDAVALNSYLKNPRATKPASTMPRLHFLDEDELSGLSSYLLSLTCEGASK